MRTIGHTTTLCRCRSARRVGRVPRGLLAVLGQLGGCPLRAQRCYVVFSLRGRIGATALLGAGVPPQPWQPLQGPGSRPDRRGAAAHTPHRAPAEDLAAHLRRLVGLLADDGNVPLFVFDARYDPIALGHELADVRAEVITRIRDDRVFCADPPPHPNRKRGTGGRPPRDGRRFKCAEGRTWAEAIGEPRRL